MIRTVLVDDSVAFRALVQALLEEAGDFEVVGVAGDGEAAVALVQRLQPDLVVMDVMLGGTDGLVATRDIMERTPCPVVVVSSLVDSKAQQVVFEALSAGAVDVLAKPRDAKDRDVRQRFVASLRTMARLKVVRRRSTRPTPPEVALIPLRVVVIGASTGGPPALAKLLAALSPGFPAPIVIAQHLAIGFTAGLARWLGDVATTRKLRARVVNGEEPLLPGNVYLAADGFDVTVGPAYVTAVPAPPSEAASPNVDKLFDSAKSFGAGPGVVAVLLTGMGGDGARGLGELRALGHHTIGQDEPSSLVYGMPRVARERGAVVEELALDAIGPRLNQLAGRRSA